MPLHPQVKPLVDAMAAMDGPKLHEMEPAAAREMFAAMRMAPPESPELASVTDGKVMSSDGHVIPIRTYLPKGVDTPLYEACREYVAVRLPGAELLPLVTPGFTDSHWVRDAFGTVSYGFAPVFAMDLHAYNDGVHGRDECLDVADLVEMTEFHLHALRALSG